MDSGARVLIRSKTSRVGAATLTSPKARGAAPADPVCAFTSAAVGAKEYSQTPHISRFACRFRAYGVG